MIISEHDEQVAVIQWWESYARTQKIDPRLLFAIPNGGKRDIRAAVRFKAEGVRAGIPDLFLALPRTSWQGSGLIFPGLFVELKRQGQKVRPGSEQEAMISLLRQTGWNVVVAIGFSEAQRAITAYVDNLK